MFCLPGTRVILRHTGEHAVVVERIDDDTLLVRLENDPSIEIPAFEEDLVLARPASAEVQAGAVPPPRVTMEPTAPPLRQIKSAQPPARPQGISMVFEPMPGRDGAVSRYTVWLLNDTMQEGLFEVVLDTANRLILKAEGKLEATSALELGAMFTDDLSDRPEIYLSCQRITTEGLTEPIEKRLRIRVKTFFNARQAVPILGIEGHRFVLLEPLDASVQTPSPEADLREYARQHTRNAISQPLPNARPLDLHNVAELAQFSDEIDLHAERLIPNYRELDRGQILHLQLAHFRAFIEKAMRLGIARVFVIHGIGEGRLREAIAEELRQHPGVWKFKNEYHRKYGYGATEVIFY